MLNQRCFTHAHSITCRLSLSHRSDATFCRGRKRIEATAGNCRVRERQKSGRGETRREQPSTPMVNGYLAPNREANPVVGVSLRR